MKIKTRFNQWSIANYHHYIDQHKKYTNFNILGVYRSILENKKLSLEDKIAVRDYAHQRFQKTFDFLQLKDPWTYRDLVSLGLEMTVADKAQLWTNIRHYQQAYLKEKKIKHRNFGTYAKHDCGYEHCPMNGIMIRQGTRLAECEMWFDDDTNPNKATYKRAAKHRPNWSEEIQDWEEDREL